MCNTYRNSIKIDKAARAITGKREYPNTEQVRLVHNTSK